MNGPNNETELDRDLEQIAAEVEGYLLSKQLRGFAAVLVLADGNVLTRVRWLDQAKLPTLAGADLLHQQILSIITPK